ncbi:hypothetical protein [Leptothoe sp. PORK10 BA2]|uniref:hypothetical protein n=1 Tax=Leptothoe sp. PORK10 BA2 TaxID=3110254 RepID=UPI002B1F63A6|nr:hypothetical protein [Leptothoe sp. PORK10 BA2]MEA5463386.1 hypothetical protein [Leptothoe sp. PORK10 BA2]
MVKKKSSQEPESPTTSKRVSFSISSDPETIEGRIVNHLRDNKMVNMRESVIRALKAYYLPWAYEDQVSKEEAQVLARNAIDELEFRIFQIRRHFLAGEAYGPKLSESLGGSPAPLAGHGPGANGYGAQGTAPMSPEAIVDKITPPKPSSADAAATTQDTNPASISDILEDGDIDPDVLDDF